MGLNSLEILSKLSNFVQITVLVLVFLSALLQASKFVLDNKIKHLKAAATQERFVSLEKTPDFDQNMWGMLTGIPSAIFRNYHLALDLYDLKNYSGCAETVQLAIDDYEKIENWDLKDHDAKQHNEKLSEIFNLAAKANTRINNHELSYEYSKKALDSNKTHFTHYSLAAAAYNLKKYQEALSNINKAIETKPIDSKPNISVYNEIKDKCQKHL